MNYDPSKAHRMLAECHRRFAEYDSQPAPLYSCHSCHETHKCKWFNLGKKGWLKSGMKNGKFFKVPRAWCPPCALKKRAKEEWLYKWEPYIAFGVFCLLGAALIAFLAWHQCNVQLIC